jgi:hypothetical protein
MISFSEAGGRIFDRTGWGWGVFSRAASLPYIFAAAALNGGTLLTWR